MVLLHRQTRAIAKLSVTAGRKHASAIVCLRRKPFQALQNVYSVSLPRLKLMDKMFTKVAYSRAKMSKKKKKSALSDRILARLSTQLLLQNTMRECNMCVIVFFCPVFVSFDKNTFSLAARRLSLASCSTCLLLPYSLTLKRAVLCLYS